MSESNRLLNLPYFPIEDLEMRSRSDRSRNAKVLRKPTQITKNILRECEKCDIPTI